MSENDSAVAENANNSNLCWSFGITFIIFGVVGLVFTLAVWFCENHLSIVAFWIMFSVLTLGIWLVVRSFPNTISNQKTIWRRWAVILTIIYTMLTIVYLVILILDFLATRS